MKKIYTLLAIAAFLFPLKGFSNYIISPYNYEWCGTSFPTYYVSANFSITETYIYGNSGFTKNQTSETLIITLPAGLEFKTSGTTAIVTANVMSSPEVIIDSFKFNSATQFTVWITTTSNNFDYNTIYFNKFEIRAIAPIENGIIRRGASPNNGTFKIDNSASIPGSQAFGTFSARTPYSYSSSIVDQLLTTTTINQFSINNPILRITINGTGYCGSKITQFRFSAAGSDGTDSLRNISKAKVYYSASPTFNYATASLFGTADNPVSTNFIINGVYLTNVPTIYFYLCYDVPGDAYTDEDGNRLDASLTSFVINGVTITNMSTPSPAGCRRIVPSAFYYSNSSGNWTDNIWSVTQGGPSCNCQPNGAGIVTIDSGTIVSVNKSRKVDVVNIMQDGSMQGGNSNMNFYVTNEINVYDNGYFSFLGDLIVRGNVNIFGTGTSWYHKVDSIEGNLYIGPEATLKNFAASTNDLTVSGNLTVFGILENTHASIALFNTSDFDGTGVISTDFLLIHDGIKTFKSTADLDIDASLILKGNSRIDNFGIINIRGNMDAEISTSRWINEPGSVLYYGGSATMFATNGYLVANSENNSVHYSGLTDQSIIGPENLTYYHLVLEGSGTKFMWTDLHLLGNLTFDASFAHMQKIISVDGTIMQYFVGSVTPTLYDLAMSNSGDGLTLQLPVFYEGNLKLSTGKIFTTMTNILTAKDNAKVTSGTMESFVNGPMQKIGNDAFVYPVGKNDIWARIGISEPQSTAAAFIAEYFYESYSNTSSVSLPLDHVSTVEYWNLLRNAKANDSVRVTLFWESATRSAINSYLSLLVAGWSETSWQSKGQSSITYSDPGNITSNIVHNFGPFTFGSSNNGDNPLPITLINYDVKLVNDIAVNIWSTATEINNDYFTIEKSRDAISFERVEIIKGAGNSNQILHYSCNDNNPLPGTSYYRLKQTDFDGKFSYSKIVAVVFEDLLANVIYPNPFRTSLNIILDKAPLPGSNTVFKIYSLPGGEVVNMPLKNQSTTIEVDDIPAGSYYYKIEVNGQPIQSGKLVSQKK